MKLGLPTEENPQGITGGSGVFDSVGPQGAPLDLPEVEYSRIPFFDPLNRPDGTYDYIGNAEAPTTLGTRLDGVLRVGAGVFQGLGAIGLLFTPEPTAGTKALGVGVGALALDNLQAGAWQIWTGQPQETMFRQGAEAALSAAGASDDAAQIGATFVDLGANTVAAGAASAGASNLAKLSRAKRAGEAGGRSLTILNPHFTPKPGIGTQAVIPPYITSFRPIEGSWPAIMKDGKVYVHRFHIEANKMANGGVLGPEDLYGSVSLDPDGNVIRVSW